MVCLPLHAHIHIMKNKGYLGHLGRKEKLQNKQPPIVRKKSRVVELDSYNPSPVKNVSFLFLSPSRLTSCVPSLPICAVGNGLVKRAI